MVEDFWSEYRCRLNNTNAYRSYRSYRFFFLFFKHRHLKTSKNTSNKLAVAFKEQTRAENDYRGFTGKLTLMQSFQVVSDNHQHVTYSSLTLH